MDLVHVAEILSKVHLAFYKEALKIEPINQKEVKLTFKNEIFSVENIIPTRVRIIFPDYVGKIGSYRNLFGHIMKNDDNVCDTSDFIDLPLSHVKSICNFIDENSIQIIETLKTS